MQGSSFHSDVLNGAKGDDESIRALLGTLENAPWWNSNPRHYPGLLTTPRSISAIDCLSKVSLLSNWSNWGHLDKFFYLSSALAACSKFVNPVKSGDDSRVNPPGLAT